jgi:hypothetical protein
MPSYISRFGRRPLALIRTALSALTAVCSHAGRFSLIALSVSNPLAALRDAPMSSARRKVTGAEFKTVRASSAYELVFWLRPEFLRTVPGAAGALSHPTVFIDKTDAGPLPLLSDIPAIIVAEIRYVPPAEALEYFGSSHAGGIIVVNTKR